MNLCGRKEEIEILNEALLSNRNEFVVVFGRRRVGKTYLIDEFFSYSYSFYATGVAEFKKNDELKSFHQSLLRYGHRNTKLPKDWFEAFNRLIELLDSNDIVKDIVTNKRIVFIDELPWLDTPKSDFKAAFDYFWNSYGAKQKDLVFIVCGSATSWIVNNLLASRGGFHNRITRQIYVKPFSLKECEQYLLLNGFNFNRHNLIELYMIFGGVPYYLNMLNPRLSVAQNVDRVCFGEYAPLKNEFKHLFASLFKNYQNHLNVIQILCKKRMGMLRKELSELSGIEGERLSTILSDLEECGFIRKYHNYIKNKSSSLFQLIDPFTLFSINFINDGKIQSYINYVNSPSYYSFCGLSFEMVCLNNIKSIKKALGIDKIETNDYSFVSRDNLRGTQIDLLIDRKDKIINLCEMKYSNSIYTIDKEYDEQLRNKVKVFMQESKTKSAINITFITSLGLKKNTYYSTIQNDLDGDALFM